jgi:hypothetical protein
VKFVHLAQDGYSGTLFDDALSVTRLYSIDDMVTSE